MVLVMSAVITGNSSGVSEIWNDAGVRKAVRCGVRIACVFFWERVNGFWCYSLSL